MPRNLGTIVENSFVKGLITEATGLNFPEQAVTEQDNCVFTEIGTVTRRLGIDREVNAGIDTISTAGDPAYATYAWEAAAGNGDNSIMVVQVGLTLYFYLVISAAVSDTLIDTLDLTPYVSVGVTDADETECQFASGNGFLFVAHPTIQTLYLSYDPGTDQVTANAITLKIRDFEGEEQDTLEVDERPAALDDFHLYNLYNQGWTAIQAHSAMGEAHTLEVWDDQRTDFPSNCDVPWYYRDVASGNALYYTSLNFNPMNTPANKGHFILDYLDQDRPTIADNVDATFDTPVQFDDPSDLTTTSSGIYNPSTIAFFTGRVWYAGVQGEKYSNSILFSQIIERDEQIGYCYQQNDPTSENIFELLPSDGGTILIPDAGTVVKLFAYEDSMIIFATNGIWAISGSEGVGFRANDYAIRKISSVPALTNTSFISLQGTPCFWNTDAIYVVANSEVGSLNVQSLTDSTIKTFYQAIPLAAKRLARGAFNSATRVATWVYADDADSGYNFYRMLHFNVLSKAFYTYTVDNSDVAIRGVTTTPLRVATQETKYLITYNSSGDKMSFANEFDEDYIDWDFFGAGETYTSSFVTGYKISGEGQRKIQPTYTNLYFKTKEVNSTVDFRSRWQYATTGNTGRYSSTQRIATTSTDYDYTRKRPKTRGSGNVYQFEIRSVDQEPFELIGWSIFETSNSSV